MVHAAEEESALHAFEEQGTIRNVELRENTHHPRLVGQARREESALGVVAS